MKKSRFSETQIVSILKEADAGRPVKETCRKRGISNATYYTWKSKYGGMSASMSCCHRTSRASPIHPLIIPPSVHNRKSWALPVRLVNTARVGRLR